MKTMNKLLLACTVSTLLGSNVYAATLKLSHALPTEHPVHQSLEYFADQVKKEANLRVKVYPNGTLGDESEGL